MNTDENTQRYNRESESCRTRRLDRINQYRLADTDVLRRRRTGLDLRDYEHDTRVLRGEGAAADEQERLRSLAIKLELERRARARERQFWALFALSALSGLICLLIAKWL